MVRYYLSYGEYDGYQEIMFESSIDLSLGCFESCASKCFGLTLRALVAAYPPRADRSIRAQDVFNHTVFTEHMNQLGWKRLTALDGFHLDDFSYPFEHTNLPRVDDDSPLAAFRREIALVLPDILKRTDP